MTAPRHGRKGPYYSISAHPVARLIKLERLMCYLGQVEAGQLVVDWGAGDRPYEGILRARFANYVAVDYAPSNALHTRRPDLYIDEAERKTAPASVDCFWLTEVLEHVYRPQELLAFLHSRLRAGGHVIGSVPFAVGEHEVPFDYYRYTSFALMRMFEEAGFETLSLDRVGDCLGVLASVSSRLLSAPLRLFPQSLRSLAGGTLGLILRWPEVVYLMLHRSGVRLHRIGFLGSFPLGFCFFLRRPQSSGEDLGRSCVS
jgi:SAM-dependent methyltransferase